MVTLQGKPRISKKQLSELQFNFQIESISKHNAFLFAIYTIVCINKISYYLYFQFVYLTVYWRSTNMACKVEVSKMAKLHKRLVIRVGLTGYLVQISTYLMI